MNKKKNEAVEAVASTKFSRVVSGVLAGENVSLAGLNAGEKYFIAELSNEGRRAAFARANLKRDTLEESRQALSAYMKGIREGLGNPKSDTEIYKVSERVRKALSIAIDREFPEAKKDARAARPVQGKAETTGGNEEEEARVAPELAVNQLENNLIAVLDTALKASGQSKADLAQFAIMTIKQWMK